jgi:hypothetical protein
MLDKKPKFIQSFDFSRNDPVCKCGDTFPARRKALGYRTCLACSTEVPHIANMPMHKQAYSYTNNPELLKDNPYAKHK